MVDYYYSGFAIIFSFFNVIHFLMYIDGFNYRAWHYKNYHVTKTGSHFVGLKGNQIYIIYRVSLVIRY